MWRAKQVEHVQLYWRTNVERNIDIDRQRFHNRHFVDCHIYQHR